LIEGHPVWIVKSEMLPKQARLFTIEDGIREILVGQQDRSGKPENQTCAENCKKNYVCLPSIRSDHR
jgi:hypothetical protein